jgi:hypothetical protein
LRGITFDAERMAHQEVAANSDRCVEEVRESGNSSVCGACHINSSALAWLPTGHAISLPM